MRTIWFILAVSAAQYSSNNSDKTKLRDNALKWCDKWIEGSFTCKPPNGKVDKFQWRFKKVVDDAIWHSEGARKCPVAKSGGSGYARKRRQSEYYSEYYSEYSSEYDSEYDDIAERSGGQERAQDPQALGSKCTQALTDFFDHDDLLPCRKHGSWTRRANGLVGQVTTMMFLCMDGGSESPY